MSKQHPVDACAEKSIASLKKRELEYLQAQRVTKQKSDKLEFYKRLDDLRERGQAQLPPQSQKTNATSLDMENQSKRTPSSNSTTSFNSTTNYSNAEKTNEL
eukprot:Filipodium_phascolosomae@DN7161_c0_g1_i1.p2